MFVFSLLLFIFRCIELSCVFLSFVLSFHLFLFNSFDLFVFSYVFLNCLEFFACSVVVLRSCMGSLGRMYGP